jgi:type I restriction enzyme S subunit
MSSKDGKRKRPLVPRLRFPEFREAGEWKRYKLANFLTESRVEGNSGKVARKITVKLWGKGVFAKQESIKGSENTKYYKRSAGQFIYSKLDFLNQAFGLVPKELDGYESTVDLPCFDINDGLNPIFLLEYVKRENFYKKNGEFADGGRKAKRIQTEIFLSFPIELPHQRAEQQKIADCLSSLDERITLEAQKLEALKRHKKGLMQQLFPREGETLPRLRFLEFREAGEWNSRTIGETCETFSGGTPSTSNKKFYGGTIPFIRSAEIGESKTALFLTEEGLSSSSAKIVRKDDVLIALYGANSGEVSLCKLNGAINQAILCIRHENNNAFLYQHLTHKKHWIISAYIQGGQGNLSGEIVKSLRFNYPDPNEQQKIADCLSSLDKVISLEAQKLEALKRHKKGLMQQLFPVLDDGD